MKISEFISYNRECPICHETLTLYLQWMDSACFKAKQIEPNVYKFEPFLKTQKDEKFEPLANGSVIITDRETGIDIQFSSPELMKYSQNYQQYLFYICNPQGFKMQSSGQYEILPYKACYWRSSTNLEWKNTGELDVVNFTTKDVVNKHEAFCISIKEKDVEKVYIADLEGEEQKTEFWYYAISDLQKEENYFKPNILHKTMPLLPGGFKSMDDKARLIDRFNTWIMMS